VIQYPPWVSCSIHEHPPLPPSHPASPTLTHFVRLDQSTLVLPFSIAPWTFLDLFLAPSGPASQEGPKRTPRRRRFLIKAPKIYIGPPPPKPLPPKSSFLLLGVLLFFCLAFAALGCPFSLPVMSVFDRFQYLLPIPPIRTLCRLRFCIVLSRLLDPHCRLHHRRFCPS
jgi:hypothetical protein